MKHISTSRKEAKLHQLISDIVSNEIRNVQEYGVVVMDVKLSSDLSYCKVFVNFQKSPKKGIVALENAKGFVRTALSKTLDWRKVPEVKFLIDEVSIYGDNIDRIIREIKKNEES